jgi:hypothetical protein
MTPLSWSKPRRRARGNHVQCRRCGRNVQPYFLTQAEVDLDRSVPLEQQPELQQITGQALQTADVLADFMGGATQALDIAIYDFRLLDGALVDKIVSAVRAAADSPDRMVSMLALANRSDERVIDALGSAPRASSAYRHLLNRGQEPYRRSGRACAVPIRPSVSSAASCSIIFWWRMRSGR